MNNIAREIFRKSIHLCSASVPFFMSRAHYVTFALLVLVLIFYCVSEFLRMSGKNVFLVSMITRTASRKRDENRFVLGPVTLVAGILLASFFWNPLPAAIGIYALAFGDGLASLSGKIFGRVRIPLTDGKTVAGSLTCFAAIFISSFLALKFSSVQYNGMNAVSLSLLTASAGMLIEILPLKDFDNIVIPVVLGALAEFQLFAM